jgi:hypothetical protein
VHPKIESHFRGRFQDAPARIELQGFEAGGGGGGEASGNLAFKYNFKIHLTSDCSRL